MHARGLLKTADPGGNGRGSEFPAKHAAARPDDSEQHPARPPPRLAPRRRRSRAPARAGRERLAPQRIAQTSVTTPPPGRAARTATPARPASPPGHVRRGRRESPPRRAARPPGPPRTCRRPGAAAARQVVEPARAAADNDDPLRLETQRRLERQLQVARVLRDRMPLDPRPGRSSAASAHRRERVEIADRQIDRVPELERELGAAVDPDDERALGQREVGSGSRAGREDDDRVRHRLECRIPMRKGGGGGGGKVSPPQRVSAPGRDGNRLSDVRPPF